MIGNDYCRLLETLIVRILSDGLNRNHRIQEETSETVDHIMKCELLLCSFDRQRHQNKHIDLQQNTSQEEVYETVYGVKNRAYGVWETALLCLRSNQQPKQHRLNGVRNKYYDTQT